MSYPMLFGTSFRAAKATDVLSRGLAARSFRATVGEGVRDWHLKVAVVFDIDGVLIKGKRTLPEARRALQILHGDNDLGRRIPFLLLTNGGGVTEADKARDMSERLGYQILPEQVVLSHSPMRNLVPRYKGKRVLVVGGRGRSCVDVARYYGFDKVSSPNDIAKWAPSVWPFMNAPGDDEAVADVDFCKEQFHAVMMFHDSWNYGRDLQVMFDVLKSKGGVIGAGYTNASEQSVPVYFSNPDLMWSTEFMSPRFGQGAFHRCLNALWKSVSGSLLKYTLYGKPHAVQYEYAETCLDLIAKQVSPTIDTSKLAKYRNVYAVGDNPLSDIAGAASYGWKGVLVKTGIYNDSTKDRYSDIPPTKIVDHVEDAVRWIVEQEKRAA